MPREISSAGPVSRMAKSAATWTRRIPPALCTATSGPVNPRRTQAAATALLLLPDAMVSPAPQGDGHESATRIDRKPGPAGVAVVPQALREDPDPVAALLRLAPIRIEDAHAELRPAGPFDRQDAVRADAAVAVADQPHRRPRQPEREGPGIHDEVVVAQGVRPDVLVPAQAGHGSASPLPVPATPFPAERAPDDAVDQLAELDPGRRGRPRQQAAGGEARDGVDLEQHERVPAEEHVRPGHPLAAERAVGAKGQLLRLSSQRRADARRDDLFARAGLVLGLIGEKLALGDDLDHRERHRSPGLGILEDGAGRLRPPPLLLD